MAAPLGRFSVNFLSNHIVSGSILRYTCPIVNIFKRFNSRETKKFFKNATITQSDGWYEVNLDQRKLRTPNGNLFRVPNEALALAVATEWNAQKKFINRNIMHLTSLCNTAVDNPMHLTRGVLIKSILHFMETDTVSFFIKEPPELYKMQKDHWGSLIEMVEERYDIEVPVMEELAAIPDLNPATAEKLAKFLQSQSDWALFGYNYAVETIKSLVLTLGLMDKMITVERCVKLSRLEVDFQIERWGNVEWYHDIDLYDLQSRMSAAALFVHWSNETVKIKRKSMLSSTSSSSYVV
ncbi:ATP synthase mitochondrial F1 complex assembly factor 2-like [Mya arenaria]|uniref:ATP synthase mitochondrial F1 complex assembly factor 2-like n=1 Tax=Mya arenaria TaxID=6604 RepID=UPI0022E1BAAD|nr:ATP synthase mitochondrial F1 complex assembly factor 2-like [Mya arenaria]